jgi:pre-mRNA-splicing helicase BRR2
MKDFDKKTAVDDLFSQKLTSERFAQLISLSKKITDYGQQKDGGTTGDRADAIDDELGMAVVFEDEDEEDEIGAGFGDDGDVDYEVYGSDQEDEETEEEEEKEEAASYSNGKQGQEGTTIDATNLLGTDRSAANTTGEEADESTETGVEDDAGFRTVLHPDMVTRSKRTRRLGAAAGARQRNQAVVNTDTAVGIRSSHRQELDFAARDIDAFWIQRIVGSHYTDPLIAQEKSNHAMQLLSDDALTTRDRENELMQLFDYDKFELVQVLTRNRDLIVWCTRLARAGTDGPERQTVETEMRQRGLDWILRALQGEQTTEDMNGSSAMDVDKTAAAEAAAAPAEAPKAEGTAPQRQLDLEALTFQRGGHLMSNKQCKLPEGSFKRLKKGYEEIHVPALKAKPMASDERLIPIEELPNWAQIAFKNAEKLNRIQSRVFPIAFGADDNMLLCAPTGAGKVSNIL